MSDYKNNVLQIRFKSGLVLRKTQAGWLFDNPSWVKSGKTWAGIVPFDRIEDALAIAGELSDACEHAFQTRLDANRAEQEFYRVAMRLAPRTMSGANSQEDS